MKQLSTRWGRQLDASHVLQEYPRPLLVRNSYENLNGYWDYAFTQNEQPPQTYDGQILVPFSPEAALSGVNRQLQPDEYLWYRTYIQIDHHRLAQGMHLLLHFGAVDQQAKVYLNGDLLTTHMGGYWPFTVDLRDAALACDSETALLTVQVRDVSDTSYHARGKQKLQRGGMYYTAQSGIWQSVWMEYVPAHGITSSEVTTDPAHGEVHFAITHLPDTYDADGATPNHDHCSTPTNGDQLLLSLQIFAASEQEAPMKDPGEHFALLSQRPVIAEISDFLPAEACNDATSVTLTLPQAQCALWSPEHPYLYHYIVTCGEDRIAGYFAMRTITKEPDEKGIMRICLNHTPIFLQGVLDQGYWPDGLMSAPADEAYIFDIEGVKSMGFQMIRKHIKIEPQRFYYHCDRLGMLVWQDMVNGGTPYADWYVTYLATALSFLQIKSRDTHRRLLSRTEEAGRQEWEQEMLATIHLLKAHPSICTWVIFNEGWGQFDTIRMVQLAHAADDTRLIDAASGWYDQDCGDMNSFHNYFFPLVIPRDKQKEQRVAVLSEYGGYSYAIPEHCTTDDLYGYGTYRDTDSLQAAYEKRQKETLTLIPEGLCASVYTQVSDIEDEVNGIFTYDREIQKLHRSSESEVPGLR